MGYGRRKGALKPASNHDSFSQAGAPTVPTPGWDGICYQPPTMPNAADNMVCNFGQAGPGVDSIAIVIHGPSSHACTAGCSFHNSILCEIR